MKVKQVIIIRKDLGMRKGKMISQGAHASLSVLTKYFRREFTSRVGHIFFPSMDFWEWIDGIFTKVVVGCNSKEELIELKNKAKEAGLPYALIKDVGATEFKGVPTLTALAIGPAGSDKIDKITGDLKLL